MKQLDDVTRTHRRLVIVFGPKTEAGWAKRRIKVPASALYSVLIISTRPLSFTLQL